MKNYPVKFLLLFLSNLLLLVQGVEAKKHFLYIGTYTNGVAKGIFIYSFIDRSGKLNDLKMPVIINNPSFLTI